MHDEYIAIRKRRVQQFLEALLPMPTRATKLVQGCCYATFSERKDDLSQDESLEVCVTERVPVAVGVSSMSEPFESPSVGIVEDEPESTIRPRRRSHERFIQFVFLERHFEMDLPQPMLEASEAHRLLAERRGFFYLGDRFPMHDTENVIDTFHPLRKAYVHGDELEAAEDMAFLLFDLWRFPVDAILYHSAFGGRYSWASGKPLR